MKNAKNTIANQATVTLTFRALVKREESLDNFDGTTTPNTYWDNTYWDTETVEAELQVADLTAESIEVLDRFFYLYGFYAVPSIELRHKLTQDELNLRDLTKYLKKDSATYNDDYAKIRAMYEKKAEAYGCYLYHPSFNYNFGCYRGNITVEPVCGTLTVTGFHKEIASWFNTRISKALHIGEITYIGAFCWRRALPVVH